ncbi:D-galactonate transporter [Francisella sp. W12-1067]|nr:D-galactonate transporter [Francisella sp. W12-1067]
MAKKTFYIFVVFVLFLGALINYLDRSTLSIANTSIATDFNISPSGMGLLLSAFMWSYALSSLPAGYLIDYFGIKRIAILSMVAWAGVCILSGLAVGFYSVLVMRILLGIAEAPLFIIATKIIQQNFSVAKRGFVYSIVALGPRLANVIAPIFLVSLMLLVSWRGMFILLGVVGLTTTLIWAKLQNHSYFAHNNDGLKPKPLTKKQFKAIITNHNVIFLCIGNICSTYTYWLFITWLPFYFIETKNLSLSQMGLATSLSFLSSLISVVLGGIVSDYLIKRGVSAIASRLTPIIFGCLIAGVAIIVIPILDNILSIIFFISISIFCLGLRISPTWAIIADIAPPKLIGIVGGIQNLANFIGAGLAPLTTGFILQETGNNFSIVFIAGSIICILGSLSYLFINTEKIISHQIIQ